MHMFSYLLYHHTLTPSNGAFRVYTLKTVLNGDSHTEKSDVWAFAIVMGEVRKLS